MDRSSVLLPALAVLLALAAPAAATGDLDYQVYGKLHASLNLVDNDRQTGSTLTSNATRLGLAGSYGVSENLKVIGQLEVQFNVSREDFSLGSSRNSFVGLRGGFGTFLAGLHDTPLKTLGRRITWFEDSIGDFRSTTMGVDDRVSDLLLYELPPVAAGLDVQLAYRLDQGDWTDPDSPTAVTYGGSASYDRSGFLVGFAFQTRTEGFFDPDDEDAADETVVRGVGRYERGAWGLSALVQAIDNYAGAAGIAARTLGFEAMASPWQRWRLKGSYFGTDPNTDLENDAYHQIAAGVDHVRGDVTFYLQYAVMTNDPDQRAFLGGNDWGDQVLPAERGGKAAGLSLGLWWTF